MAIFRIWSVVAYSKLEPNQVSTRSRHLTKWGANRALHRETQTDTALYGSLTAYDLKVERR